MIKIIVESNSICIENAKIGLTESWADFIENLPDDDEERQDDLFFIVESIFKGILECFPGNTFSTFADDDNSFAIERKRTPEEITQNRKESIGFIDLIKAGWGEEKIFKLAQGVYDECRDGTLTIKGGVIHD